MVCNQPIPVCFATSNEVNSEILFTIRYKAGGLGLGSSFGNDFVHWPVVVLLFMVPLEVGIHPQAVSIHFTTTGDARKAVNIGRCLPSPKVTSLYVKKYSRRFQ